MGEECEFVPEDFVTLFTNCLATLMPESLLTPSGNTGERRFNAKGFWDKWRRVFVDAGYEVITSSLAYFYI